jgi:hypothetical protein
LILAYDPIDGGTFVQGKYQCGNQNGQTEAWARVDVANGWIVQKVQDFENSGLWVPPKLPDSLVTSSYIKLHGTACQSICDCKADEFCKNPINDPGSPFRYGKSCGACLAPPVGACSCVQGQCLPILDATPNMCHFP